jgi:hypothetical protein
VRALRLAAAVAAAILLSAAAYAQTVLRSNLPAGLATPTGASFSVRMPVAYRDEELQANDPENPAIVRMVTGVTGDGVRFSASETAFLPGAERQSLDDFMKALKANPFVGALVDVRHQKSGGRERLTFTLIDIAAGGNFFDVVQTDQVRYMLTVQFHRAQRDEAAAMKDDFFNSFKLTGQ